MSTQNKNAGGARLPQSQSDRWLKYGSNVALSVVLVIVLGIGIIWYGQRAHARVDMTGGSLSLKPQTVNVLKDLRQHITLVSLYTHRDDAPELTAEAQRVSDLLDEYKGKSSNIDVKVIDPAKEKDKLEELHQDFINRYGKQIKNYTDYLAEWKQQFDRIRRLTDDEVKAIGKFVNPEAQPDDDESFMSSFVNTITSALPDRLDATRKAINHELKQKHPDYKAASTTAKEEMESVSELMDKIVTRAPVAATDQRLPADFRKYLTDSLPHYLEMKKIADDMIAKGNKLGELKVDQLEQALNIENPVLVLGDDEWRILSQNQVWQDDTDAKALNAGGKITPRFAGEQQVTTAIYALENPKKQKICFIRGGGQPYTQPGFPPFIPGGPMSLLAEHLREYNFDVSEKDLSGQWAMQAQMRQQPAAPEPSDEEIKDAIWVVVDLPAGEQNRPTPPSQMGEKLKEHLAHGGSALVLADVHGEPLAEALKDWGVTLHPEAIAFHETIKLSEAADADPLEEAKARPYIWDCRNYGDHLLAKPIRNLDSVFVVPIMVTTTPTSGCTITPLLPLSENLPGLKTWGKTNLENLENEVPEYHPDKGDLPPPCIGGAVVEKGGGRLVVIGSFRSFTNGFLRILDPRLARRDPPIRVNRFPGNLELATNSIFWLAHLEPMIAISPSAMDVSRISDMSDGMLDFWRKWVLLIILPGLVIAAGGFMYAARRE